MYFRGTGKTEILITDKYAERPSPSNLQLGNDGTKYQIFTLLSVQKSFHRGCCNLKCIWQKEKKLHKVSLVQLTFLVSVMTNRSKLVITKCVT